MTELINRLLSTPKVSGSNPREAQQLSKPFWKFYLNIISSVHPARGTRVINSRFNRETVTARELCQVSWHLPEKRGRNPGHQKTWLNDSIQAWRFFWSNAKTASRLCSHNSLAEWERLADITFSKRFYWACYTFRELG